MKVQVTRASDADLRVGQLVDLEEFLAYVRVVLENGGEMPVAVQVPV